MSDADRYRRYAGDCVRVAQVISDSAEKALLLQMAEAWLSLAQRAQSAPGGTVVSILNSGTESD